MISAHDAMATVAVRDLDVARRFYEDVLGLETSEVMDGVATYGSGSSTLVVYVSDTAGKNPATSITWGVGNDLDDIVTKLRSAGVTFEHYDFPGMTLQGDVHVGGDFKAAWFRDPDGNILHINNDQARAA